MVVKTAKAVHAKVRRAFHKAAPHLGHAEHVTTATVATAVAFQIHVIEIVASGMLAVVVAASLYVEFHKVDPDA